MRKFRIEFDTFCDRQWDVSEHEITVTDSDNPVELFNNILDTFNSEVDGYDAVQITKIKEC